MRWYVGPWQWDDGVSSGVPFQHWSPPTGAVGALDLRSIPQQSVERVPNGFGIFASKDELSSDYELLGTGSLRDVKTSQRLNDRIPKRDRKRQPKGDDLLSLILDAICDGSDPTGDDFAKPLMPDSELRLSLNIAGITHQWKTAPWNYHWDKIQDVERADFQRCFDDAKAGRLKDSEHHRRVLDALCDKYNMQGADDWRGFVPSKLRKEVNGRLKHETTINDTFVRANQTGIGTASDGFSWSQVAGSFNISSNRAVFGVATVDIFCRAEFDLSSADHYTQMTLAPTGTIPSSLAFYAFSRYAAGAQTMYLLNNVYSGGGSVGVIKAVSGTFTSLGATARSFSTGVSYVSQLAVTGSSLTAKTDGSTVITFTDTSVTGNLRTGIGGYTASLASVTPAVSAFQASDLASSTTRYTQLETSPRGITRGVYTRNGG